MREITLLAMSNRLDRPFRFQRETRTIRPTIYDPQQRDFLRVQGWMKLPDSSAMDSIGPRPFTMQRIRIENLHCPAYLYDRGLKPRRIKEIQNITRLLLPCNSFDFLASRTYEESGFVRRFDFPAE